MDLKLSPLSLVNTIEELLETKGSGFCLEIRDCGRRGICRADYASLLYPQKLALTSPMSVDRSVGIVRSRTLATEFVVFSFFIFSCSLARV
jgi:hypothetical protein